LSGADDHDPRSKEQPQSAIATTAAGADTRRPKREAPEKAKGTGIAINSEHSRACAALVAQLPQNALARIPQKWIRVLRPEYAQDHESKAFSCGEPDCGLPQENARRKNNDAGTKARVINSNLKK
jgi:hypothetical protein